jgi:RNA polymerase sigma-70 factor (ECF subfamily)
VDGLPPVVVSTQPVAGAHNVAAGTAELRVRFSKEMTDGGWSWSAAWPGSAPELLGPPRFEADRREREELAARFFDALRDGNIDGVRELLAADVQLVADGGGKAPALARSVFGADNVARVLASIFPLLARIDAKMEPREVNGQPGAIFRDRDGKVLGTLTLDVLGGGIQTIRSVVNPDKLGHVGPVADAWAIAREAKKARRPRD